MLKCRDVAQQASDYIESERPWYRKFGWYMHLFMCKHCRRFVSQLKLTIRSSRQILNLTTGESEVQNVMKNIKKSTNK